MTPSTFSAHPVCKLPIGMTLKRDRSVTTERYPSHRRAVARRVAGAAENLAALTDLPGEWIDAVHPTTLAEDASCSTWIRARARLTASRKAARTTATSAAPATTRCSCSTSSAIWNGALCGPGNVHSADGWRDVLEPVVARYRGTVKRRYFRGDAAFANPEIYEFLEAEGYRLCDPAADQLASCRTRSDIC